MDISSDKPCSSAPLFRVLLLLYYLPKRGNPAAGDFALDVDPPELLVDLQEGEEGDVRMAVPLEDPDPILVVVLLVVQRVQHEDGRVDSWQDVREQ